MEEQQATTAPPLLEQDALAKGWRGEDDEVEVILTDAAFQHYADVYLEVHGLTEPTEQQRRAATYAIRRLTYWHDYAGYENDVHVRRKRGRHATS